jgi:hypothetical protein
MDSYHLLISNTFVYQELRDFLLLITLNLENGTEFFVNDNASVTVEGLWVMSPRVSNYVLS